MHMTITPSEVQTPNFVADFSDQTGFFNPSEFVETIEIIGLGGIGASILPTLVTMGFHRFRLWDADAVEPRNIASQLLYKPTDLYRSKAEVCREYLLEYGATNVDIVERFFTADDVLEGSVVISGVDTMAARQTIWQVVKVSPGVQFYLDGRIGGLHMTLLGVETFDGDWYEQNWLFDDKAAAPLPCTQRAIAYPAVALGAFMASYLVEWNRGNMPPKRVDLNLENLFFQTVGKRQ